MSVTAGSEDTFTELTLFSVRDTSHIHLDIEDLQPALKPKKVVPEKALIAGQVVANGPLKEVPSKVEVEWICQGRLWTLIIGASEVSIKLAEGPPALVSASLNVMPWEEASSESLVFTFPAQTALYPPSRAGRNLVTVEPTPGPSAWGVSTDGHTRLRLDLQVEPLPDPAEVQKQKQQAPSGLEDDEDWIMDDEGEEPKKPDWVLASWSGKDQDEDEGYSP